MKYRKKRLLLLKKKHIVIICVLLFAILATFVIVKLTEASRERAAEQQAVQAQLDAGLLRVGLRGDMKQLCAYNTETGQYEGLEKDIADELIAHVFEDKLLVQYVEVNSRTKDALLKIDEIDMALGASLDTGKSGIRYTVPYFADACAFLVMEGGITSELGLSGGVIAVVQNSMPALDSSETEDATNLDDYLAAQGITATVKVYASYPEAVQALSDGFVQGVCASENDLKIFGRSGMLLLAERFMPCRYCVQFAQSDEALRTVFSKAIAQMQEDGTLAALVGKWGLTDYSALPDVNEGT